MATADDADSSQRRCRGASSGPPIRPSAVGEAAHRGDRADGEAGQIAERRGGGGQRQRRQDAEEVRAAGDAVQHADRGGGADVDMGVDRAAQHAREAPQADADRVTPTMRSLHDDSASSGSAPRSASASRPTARTPPEWPRPQRKPACQAPAAAAG